MKLKKLHSHGHNISSDEAKHLMCEELKKTVEGFNNQLLDEVKDF